MLSIPRRSKKEFKLIKLTVQTSKDSSNQPESPSMALKHSTLFALLRKEIRPRRSIFDFGGSVINGIPNKHKIKLGVSVPRMDSDQTEAFYSVIYDVTDPIGGTNWAWTFSSRWIVNTTIDSIPTTVELRIVTVMTPTADAGTACGSASETPSLQESKTTESQPAAEDSMRKLHRALVDRLKETRIKNYSDAQALQLAKMAYQLSDESSQGSPLAIVSIIIIGRQDGIDVPSQHLRSRLRRDVYEASRQSTAEKLKTAHEHLVYLALGSNVGDRIASLDLACHELDRRGIRVVRTSALYETDAMYLQNQPSFINGACEVRLF